MDQKRKPPAYIEYAASALSNRAFKLMSLAERGLLYTMRLECWENDSVPSDPNELATYFGYSIDELMLGLTDRLKSHFIIIDNSYRSPELDNYREYLADRRQKQSGGGKKGAATTNAKNRQLRIEERNKNRELSNTGKPQVTYQDSRESLDDISSNNLNPYQSLDSDEWVNDYLTTEDKLFDSTH